ncbi:unnamed protein product [Cuscuta epithymum]|uniref:Uncharacterized protein n=1 Tax=Cuscuta epithymum TaxID=186058 RepID=A0AAV0FSN7_9ASTE|nr:unnamed protein product [Cuscuta epithymum]
MKYPSAFIHGLHRKARNQRCRVIMENSSIGGSAQASLQYGNYEWDIGLLGEYIIEENSVLRDEYGGFEDFTLTDNALATWHNTLEVPRVSRRSYEHKQTSK